MYGPMATYPYAPPAKPGFTVRQKPVYPARQFLQKPQATLNGITTRSPVVREVTPWPTSSITPRFSCPNTMPASAAVRPSYMCRSDPQIAEDVIRTITSFGCWILGSSTSATFTANGFSYTTAFIFNTSALHSGRAATGSGQTPRTATWGTRRRARTRTNVLVGGAVTRGTTGVVRPPDTSSKPLYVAGFNGWRGSREKVMQSGIRLR